MVPTDNHKYIYGVVALVIFLVIGTFLVQPQQSSAALSDCKNLSTVTFYGSPTSGPVPLSTAFTIDAKQYIDCVIAETGLGSYAISIAFDAQNDGAREQTWSDSAGASYSGTGVYTYSHSYPNSGSFQASAQVRISDGVGNLIDTDIEYQTVNVGTAGAACSNNVDDDGDGAIDFSGSAGAPGDPGCSSASDTSELPSASPSVDIRANGYQGPIDWPQNTNITLDWTSNANGWDWKWSEGRNDLTGATDPTCVVASPLCQSGNMSRMVSPGPNYFTYVGNYTLDFTDTVIVNGVSALAPTCSITASPANISTGQNTTVTWTTGNSPTSCTASGDWSGSKNIAGGSELRGPLASAGTYTYALSCTNTYGTQSCSTQVDVSSAGIPAVDIQVEDPAFSGTYINGIASRNDGQSAQLRWRVTSNYINGTTECMASGAWSGSKPIASTYNYEVRPSLAGANTYTYTIQCSNDGFSTVSSDTVSVSVAGAGIPVCGTQYNCVPSTEVFPEPFNNNLCHLKSPASPGDEACNCLVQTSPSLPNQWCSYINGAVMPLGPGGTGPWDCCLSGPPPSDVYHTSDPSPNDILVATYPVTFDAHIRNDGPGDTQSGFVVSFTVVSGGGSFSPNPISTTILPGGQSRTVTSGSWVPPSAGTYTIRACVDPGNTLNETRRSNNCQNRTVTVAGTILPNLISRGIQAPGSPGSVIDVVSYIENIGFGDISSPINARLRIDEGDNGTWDLTTPTTFVTSTLPSGGLTYIRWNNIWTVATGTSRFEVCADPTNTISETQELDNCTEVVRSYQSISCGATPYTCSSVVWEDPFVPASCRFMMYVSGLVACNCQFDRGFGNEWCDAVSGGLYETSPGNYVCQVPPPPGSADLVVVGDSNIAGTPYAGTPLTIEAPIHNQESDSTKNSSGLNSGFNVRYRINGAWYATEATSYMTCNQQRIITTPWTPPVSGTYTLQVCADSSNAIVETDEGNNCHTQTVTIYDPPPINISTESLYHTPTNPATGTPMTFGADIANWEVARAGQIGNEIYARFRLDANSDGSWDIPGNTKWVATYLDSGAVAPVSWAGIWTAALGTHTYEICADPGNLLSESNEADNCQTRSFTLPDTTGPPPFAVGMTATPTSGPAALTSSLSASVIATQGPYIYRYDCDDDGAFEQPGVSSLSTTYAYSCTYSTPGTYTARVVAQDFFGSTSTDTAVINVYSNLLTPVLDLKGGAAAPYVDGPISGIADGSSITMQWSVSNATDCQAAGSWSGTKASTGGTHTQLVGPLSGPGTYQYDLTCTNSNGSSFDSVTVLVDPPSAPCPATPVLPTNGATGISIYTPLDWSDACAATSYNVYFGTSPSSLSLLGSTILSQYPNSLLTPVPLAYDTDYYWRIDAVNSGGTTVGGPWIFTTEPTPGPICSITASFGRTTLLRGQSTDITWSCDSPVGVVSTVLVADPAPPASSAVAQTGSLTVTPPVTTRYTITACNAGGCTSETAVISIFDPQIHEALPK